jgi:hypothetical protein
LRLWLQVHQAEKSEIWLIQYKNASM